MARLSQACHFYLGSLTTLWDDIEPKVLRVLAELQVSMPNLYLDVMIHPPDSLVLAVSILEEFPAPVVVLAVT